MRPILLLLLSAALLFTGCASGEAPADIAATTAPVYEFTALICRDTPLTVTRLVTGQVSCLHDYSLNVRQVKAAEAAQVVVISGAGLEAFLDDTLSHGRILDASQGIELLCPTGEHDHDHGHDHDHHHESDPHIWLSPIHAAAMAQNICRGLTELYPQYEAAFRANTEGLIRELEALQQYGEQTLDSLSSRELITFHDGFAYFAQAFRLTIVRSIEEESGSEASAGELRELIDLVDHHGIKAVFTERNGSASAAQILSRETGCGLYALDMAMGDTGYFEAMRHNIDTIKEALQ